MHIDIDFGSLDAGIAKHELKLTITLNERSRSTVSEIYSYFFGIERFLDILPLEGGDKPRHYGRSIPEQAGAQSGRLSSHEN